MYSQYIYWLRLCVRCVWHCNILRCVS